LFTPEIPLFEATRAALIRAKFPPSDILPLIPPGAVLSENSKVHKSQLGKIPGRYSNGAWSGLRGEWASAGLDAHSVEAAKSWPTQNAGLRAASFPAIDIDTSTPEGLALVENVVRRTVPGATSAPVRYRDGAPRALIVFRLAPGSSIRKAHLEWKDSDGAVHAVDVLGHGQQYAICGTHPSGAAYKWREGKDLSAIGLTALPALTTDSVTEFLDALKTAVLAAGGEIITAKSSTGAGEKIDFANADPAIDPELALEALNSIPNDPDTLPTREGLVAILASFKAATGREAESLRFDALEWATEHGWADSDYFDKIWDSLTESHVPHDHLVSMARKHGWRGDAVLDFKEFGPDDIEIIEKHSGGPITLPAPDKCKPNVATAIEIITCHIPNHFKYDEMRCVVMLMRPLDGEQNFKPRPVEDNDYVILQEAMQRGGVHGMGPKAVYDAVGRVGRLNRFHPIRDYLNGLQWDGKDRLTTFYPRYFGAEDNEYTRAIGPKLPLAMVARVMEPGCKADYMVVLESDQGDRKSMMGRILAGDFFSDTLPKDVTHKDAKIHLKAKWLVEMSEMAPLKKADMDDLKGFLTTEVDVYRPVHGKEEVHQPRQVVFIGTTNNAEYLRDPTGARRFWPVATGVLDPDALREDRDQIFAEAMARYKRGEPLWLDREFEKRVIKPEQDARFEADIWEQPVADFLANKNETTLVEIAQMVIGKSLKDVGSVDTVRLKNIAVRLGFKKKKANGAIKWMRVTPIPIDSTGAGDEWDKL